MEPENLVIDWLSGFLSAWLQISSLFHVADTLLVLRQLGFSINMSEAEDSLLWNGESQWYGLSSDS